MEIPLRSPSTRRASLSARRAWAPLHKSPSTTKFNKKNPPGKIEDELSFSSVNPTTIREHQYRALSDLPIHSSAKKKKPSKSTFITFNNYDIDSSRTRSTKSNAQDLDLDLHESFVAISSIRSTDYDLVKREKGLKEEKESLSTGSSTQSNEVHSDCKENIDMLKDEYNGESEELGSYMKIREQNLKANQEFLACIGMQKAKDDLDETSIAKKKTLPTQRGLSKRKKDAEPLPRRHSMRIRRIDPAGVPLPEPEPEEHQFVEQRLPERVSMKERHYSKHQHVTEDLDLKPFLSTISSLKCEDNFPSVFKIDTKENRKVISDIQNLKITEEQVAKVVPGRVYSVAWHPSKDSMIAVAGDAHGYVGCWNVLAKENDSNMVRAFQPHIRPVSHLFIPPNDGHKLYTCSYDATLRCGDFEKGVFDLVYSVPEENDDLFRNFDFIGNTSSMLVSHLSGLVSLVDCRTSSKSAEQVFNISRSLRKVSVHPLSTHYFITAGRDTAINLWDLRSMGSKHPKAVQIMRQHTKGIASASFSPISGNHIVSSSTDDTIQIHTVTEGIRYELTSRMRHNNHTGRWLTPFQPAWHPTAEGIFVSGSMARPRQIEVFNSNGGLIAALQGEYLGSVCSLNAFHPTRPTAIVGANSSGRLHVFM